MQARLYVIPGSHPSMTARLMLERKAIPYKRVDLMPVISRAALKLHRFPGVTVPALRIDARRIQGSREIASELERIKPDPPLFPADPAERAAVEEAERFGAEDLQPVARRILWWALRTNRAPLASFSHGAQLGVPTGVAVRTAGPVVAASARLHNANDETVRTDLAALPGLLTRVDDYIAAGTLGGKDLNAGDLQVSTCIRLLMTLDDLRPFIESRPCGELAIRAVPDFPGQVPPVLPSAWLTPLRGVSAQASAERGTAA